MQTKNQISLTRKTLYGIMLLGLFFSIFGVGNLPSVQAQIQSTNIPDNWLVHTDHEFGYKIDYPSNFMIRDLANREDGNGVPSNKWFGDSCD